MEAREFIDRFVDRAEANRYGEKHGFGSCRACGNSWLWAKSQDLTCSEGGGRGMIPICVMCFEELDDEAVLNYCRELWLSWGEVPTAFPADILRESIKDAREKKS